MNDRDDANAPPDGRSMSEILASIRRIVSDEERARREAERRRIAREGDDDGDGEGGGGRAFELTASMRAPADAASGDPGVRADAGSWSRIEPEDEDERFHAPLDLGVAARLVSPPVRFAPAPGLSEAEIEAVVRRVVREELRGPVGMEISRKVKASIREEVRRVLEDDEDPLI